MKGTDREQRRAVLKVWRAVKAGVLVPPDRCSRCGDAPGAGSRGQRLIQGHHHKGYGPEHVLDVIWLCPSCHKIVDGSPQWSEQRKREQSKRLRGVPLLLTKEQRKSRSERCRSQKPWEARWGTK